MPGRPPSPAASNCRSGDIHGHSVALSNLAKDRASMNIAEPFEEPTLDPAHPREWHVPLLAVSGRLYRQLLGLNPFKSSYISIFYALETRLEKAVACSGVVFAIAAGVPLPILGVILGRLISTFPPPEDELRTRISQLLGVAVAYFVATALYTTAFGLSSEKISMRLRQRLLRSLLHLDQSYMDTHEIDVHSMLTEKIDLIHNGTSEKIGIFIQSMSYFAAAFAIAFVLSPKLAGILLSAVLPTMGLVVWSTSRKIAQTSSQADKHRETANGLVESALGAVRVVQAFDMMAELCRSHSRQTQSIMTATVRTAVFSAVQLGAIYFVAYSINGLAFYVGSQMAVDHPQTGAAGTVFAVVLLIMDSSFVVTQFAPYLDIFARAASARQTMQEIFEASEASQSSKAPDDSEECGSLRGKAVRFQNVSFAYPARPEVKALNGMDLHIRPAALTAIVGTSGGGKSTLISLLTGFYPYVGSINLGQDELRDLSITAVRSQMAMVEQEPVLFAGTIFDNVCSAIVDAHLPGPELVARCERALRDASVDFLDELPQGMHTHIGSELQLSGGQKQRICLARALIRRPAVLILDEPTSALDARSEARVMEAVGRATKTGMTVIMIAHRLSTVLAADHIALMSEGKVLEQGTPDELSVTGTMFQGLLKTQMTKSSDRRSSSPIGLAHHDQPKKTTPIDFDVNGKADPSASLESPPPTKCETEISAWTLMKRSLRVAMPESLWIAVGLLASITNGALVPAEAYVFGALVQLLNTAGSEPDFLRHAYFFCLLFFILGCVALASRVCSGTAFGVVSARTVARIQSRLLDHLLHLDMEWFSGSGRSVHDLMSAFTKDAGDLSSLSGQALGTIFSTITSVFGGIILAHIVAWKIAVVLLAAVPVMLLSGFLRLWVLMKGDSRRRSAYNHATALAAEACRHRRTVAVFGLEAHILGKYAMELETPRKQGQRFTVWSNILLAMAFAVTYFIYALAYWWGSREVASGLYNERQFFTVMTAMLFSAQYAGQLFSLSPEIARAKAAAASIFTLMSHVPHILSLEKQTGKGSSNVSRSPSPHHSPQSAQSEDGGKISFDMVSFAYTSHASRPVLQDVNLSVPAGSTVALVGPSGAGKTSTISLIERFHDPTSGSVRIDGQDIRQMDITHLRNTIGLVSQDPDLLPGSIAYNIRLGAADPQTITDANIEAVCAQCGLHDFITSLPEGYSTECGSYGATKLSGGQRQRIALARALIRKPEILLLDEPTSALDAHTERQVQDAISRINEAGGRNLTTVIVAHRLASVRRVDCVYVFDQGRVVERGTHGELVAVEGGLYASMARAQGLG